jgi:hypothetical protein
MTRHGEDYDQLRGLVETFTERVGEAISQAEEVTAEDGEDPNEWRQLIARTLDAALQLDDAGLRRKGPAATRHAGTKRGAPCGLSRFA